MYSSLDGRPLSLSIPERILPNVDEGRFFGGAACFETTIEPVDFDIVEVDTVDTVELELLQL